MAVVGVDEAGKGPVLGSMFAAAVRWPSDSAPSIAVADSKSISPDRRQSIADQLRATDGVSREVVEVPVSRIDAPESDMNTLTRRAHASAAAAIAKSGDLIRCDAADVNAERFGRRLQDALQAEGVDGLDIRAQHRADERHPVVAAASVLAKVARDAHVGELATEYGDIGSGYPSDPTTRTFLEEYIREHGRLPDCARSSWSTSRRALAAADHRSLDEF
ncbi:MAG: ribonuclease HII [Halobacteriales archaeon]